MNKIKPPQNRFRKPPRRPARSMKTRRRFVRLFRALNLFGYIDVRSALQAMPFILFLSGLALVYIANSYYTEKTIREIDRLNHEIKEYQSEFITVKSDLMIKSGQSQVAEAVAPLELEESREAPAKIVAPAGNDDEK